MSDFEWSNQVAMLSVNVAGRFEWGGREWELGATPAQPREWLLVFRGVSRPDEFFFLAQRSMSGSQEVFPEAMLVHEPPSLPVWRESLKLSLEHGAWGRLLWFDSKMTPREGEFKAKWRLFLLPDRRGAWRRIEKGYDGHRHALAPFVREGNELNFGLSSTSQWVDWTREALEQQSDLRFALDFTRLSQDRQFETVVKWKSGTRSEFERVCAWLGRIAVEWDERDDKRLEVRVLLSEEEPDFLMLGNRRKSRLMFSNVERAQQLWLWAWRVFGPRFDTDLAQRRASVAAWLHNQPPVMSIGFKPIESNHERMEVVAQLLYWARSVGVEAELLSQLEEN